MSGAIPPLSNTLSWRGAQLKAQGQLYLYLLCILNGHAVALLPYAVPSSCILHHKYTGENAEFGY
jgi:hypothetical protein